MRPVIGITLDWQKEGTYSKRPHYALREHYFNIIHKAGGLPVGIPYIPSLIDDYISEIDGLLIPGGDFGLDPKWYIKGEKEAYAPSPRLKFDTEILRKALDKNMPVLGICAGMQIMGGTFGCKLTSNVNKYLNTTINHLNEVPSEEFAHDVNVSRGTLLHAIVGCDFFSVNTSHIEAIVEVHDKVKVSGTSSDGVIEAIELSGYRFALGVQWHPEYFDNPSDPNFLIIKDFIKVAKG